MSNVSPLFIPYKKYSARSVAVRNASFTAEEFQPKVETFPLLSTFISIKSSNVIFSVDLTAELIVLVANSIVFSSAISIKVGLIPRSIIQIVRNITNKNNIDVSKKSERGVASVSSRNRRLNIKRSEEHTSELQSRGHLVCRLLLEKKKKT